MKNTNQVNNPDTQPEGRHEEDLHLLDAFSLATNFFLFLLILFLALSRPGNITSGTVFVLLTVFAVCSAILFLMFSAFMFMPKGMGRFKEFLSYSHKSSARRFLSFLFVLLLWASLPITFLAGIVDATSQIPERWQVFVRSAGLLWILVVPLAAVVTLLFRRRQVLKRAGPNMTKTKQLFKQIWASATMAVTKEGPRQFIFIAVTIAVIQLVMFLLPAFPWLPAIGETDSFLKVLWQVHASILGVTVVVVTIIITVIANEKDRTRTWKLYAEKTRFVSIIWYNLFAIISEGIASLQTSQVSSPIFASDKTGNLILSEGIFLVISVLIAATLFTVTMRFLDDDYVEDLAEKRIIRAMPDAVEADLERMQRLISQLRGDTDGH